MGGHQAMPAINIITAMNIEHEEYTSIMVEDWLAGWLAGALCNLWERAATHILAIRAAIHVPWPFLGSLMFQ